jgi:hypothetical protein
MRSCKTCRHSFAVTKTDAKRSMIAGHMGAEPLSILESPTFAALPHVEEWRGCKARNSLVPANMLCHAYGSRLAGLFVPASKDAELYARLQARLAAERKAELARARQATAEAEANVKTRPCEGCGLVHARCGACEMPWAYCGRCQRCGGGTRYVRSLDRWECSLCEADAVKPTSRMEWNGGLCDGCRETAAAKEPTHAHREQPR